MNIKIIKPNNLSYKDIKSNGLFFKNKLKTPKINSDIIDKYGIKYFILSIIAICPIKNRLIKIIGVNKLKLNFKVNMTPTIIWINKTALLNLLLINC